MASKFVVPSAQNKLITKSKQTNLKTLKSTKLIPEKLGTFIIEVHDENYLEDREYFVRRIPASSWQEGAQPETLTAIPQQDFDNVLESKNLEENVASFEAEVNFSYRIYLLTWIFGDDELSCEYLYETSTYNQAYTVYQQQYQILHQHGPYDETTQEYSKINVRGIKQLFPDEIIKSDDLTNSFIAILSCNNCEKYFNFLRE